MVRDPYEDLRSEVEEARALSPEEHALVLEALCRMAAEQIAQHPDPAKALAWQDPRSPETEALLRRLRDRYREG